MAARSRKLGPGTLTIGDTTTQISIANRMGSCSIEYEFDEEDDIPVLSGDEIIGEDDESATLVGTAYQDYVADSLLVFAEVYAGQILPFVFTPVNDDELSWEGSVKVRRLNVGGEVKERNTSDISWPCVGIPTMMDSAGAPITAYPHPTV